MKIVLAVLGGVAPLVVARAASIPAWLPGDAPRAAIAAASAVPDAAADAADAADAAAVAPAAAAAAAAAVKDPSIDDASTGHDAQSDAEKTLSPPKQETTPEQQAEVAFKSGSTIRYGLSVSLLEFSVSRASDEPGRLRNYAPKLDVFPTEVGFQFLYLHNGSPWRLQRERGKSFQLMSWGGMLLVRIDNRSLAQGAIRLGTTLNFFENAIGLGIGFDLYRGIPIRGSDGTAGGDTAYTGILSWAFAPHGEVTPENVFIGITFGLEPVVRLLTGEIAEGKK
ncbi:hypothetical protein [Pendulispora albinea]|uniref:Uncharacterized protein n=1 Tax=Pendulispora albinea TaxID=2741071 RepID=A0ABZ2M6U2_9BACT